MVNAGTKLIFYFLLFRNTPSDVLYLVYLLLTQADCFVPFLSIFGFNINENRKKGRIFQKLFSIFFLLASTAFQHSRRNIFEFIKPRIAYNRKSRRNSIDSLTLGKNYGKDREGKREN